jgi:hypothetical protein
MMRIRFIFSKTAVRPPQAGGVEKPPLTGGTTRVYYHTVPENRKKLLEKLHATRALLSATRRELEVLKTTVSKTERKQEQKMLKQLIHELTCQEVDALQKWVDDCEKRK